MDDNRLRHAQELSTRIMHLRAALLKADHVHNHQLGDRFYIHFYAASSRNNEAEPVKIECPPDLGPSFAAQCIIRIREALEQCEREYEEL